jgi:hypothetical protein
LHWADKQKPLAEVAGPFDPFQHGMETAPSLVPEAPDAETPAADEEVKLVERVRVTEHFTVVDYVPAHRPSQVARRGERERVA